MSTNPYRLLTVYHMESPDEMFEGTIEELCVQGFDEKLIRKAANQGCLYQGFKVYKVGKKQIWTCKQISTEKLIDFNARAIASGKNYAQLQLEETLRMMKC